ncbi:MAG: DMT family transporter [Sphingopyxis sp.]|nr:DMT family transporter [Sphingopyxis sp.]
MNNRQIGMLFALLGYVLLTIGDAMVKSMAGDYPGTAITTLRFLIGAVGIGIIIYATKGRAGFAVPRPRMQMARGLALATASLCFYSSLFFMPLAEATVISFAAPIVIALMSGWLFGERVPPISWVAMLAATAGVIIVLRPNIALYGTAALLPIVAMLAMSVFVMLNRASANDVSPLASQFWVALYATPIQFVVTLAGHFSGEPSLVVHALPTLDVVLRCAFVALSASSAHMLLFMATRRVSPATMAPTSYAQIIVAIGLGIIVFDDWPDAVALAGIALIVAAGLALWYASGTKRTDGEEVTP